MAVIFSLFSFSYAQAELGVNIGLSGSMGVFHAEATETEGTDVATDEIKDKLIQDVKNNERKARPVKTTMKKIVEFDWSSTGLDEKMYSPIIARAKQVLTELEDEGRYRQRDVNRDRVAQFINRYLEGEHQPLEDLVAGKNTQRAQTFENRRKLKISCQW